jgi:hypothetical protein
VRWFPDHGPKASSAERNFLRPASFRPPRLRVSAILGRLLFPVRWAKASSAKRNLLQADRFRPPAPNSGGGCGFRISIYPLREFEESLDKPAAGSMRTHALQPDLPVPVRGITTGAGNAVRIGDAVDWPSAERRWGTERNAVQPRQDRERPYPVSETSSIPS